jgi:hypothetical protein
LVGEEEYSANSGKVLMVFMNNVSSQSFRFFKAKKTLNEANCDKVQLLSSTIFTPLQIMNFLLLEDYTKF